MKRETTSKAATGVGIFAAIAASLCCITPVLALLAGASGAASSLSWLEPVRPYLIGLAIAALAFAWYKSLSNKENTQCGPDGTCLVENKSFLSSKTFLIIITIAAIALMAFPYYANLFYPKPQKQNIVVVESNNINTASFTIKGMSCKACEAEVNNELYKVPGVIEAQTFYNKETSIVRFDKSKADILQLQSAIENTGYKVTNHTVNY
ncbi:MAG TPA: mercuric transport protein MerTP [Chitinophagaceae bacterium]|nr:mercuric transport protein MerTP [Chitinophagaceae bacterium]